MDRAYNNSYIFCFRFHRLNPESRENKNVTAHMRFLYGIIFTWVHVDNIILEKMFQVQI